MERRIPALFTSASIRPKRFMVIAQRRLASAGFVTSVGIAIARPPLDSIDPTTSAAVSAFTVGDRDGGSVHREPLGDGSPDPLARSGHDRHSPVEPSFRHACLLSPVVPSSR